MQTFKATKAIAQGWRLGTQNFFITLGLLLAYLVVNMLLSLLATSIIAYVVISLFSLLLSIVFGMGIIRITVRAVDGEEPRFEMFREVLPRALPFLGINILITLIVSVIYVAIYLVLNAFANADEYVLMAWTVVIGIIPCLYLAIRLFFAPYLVVENNLGVIDALKTSWKASSAVQGELLLFYILSFLVMLLGFICLFVGVFMSVIVIYYAQAYLYRSIFTPITPDVLLVDDAKVNTALD